ncbi:hypothetical protein CPB84DRAFT_1768408 [Gymnopilus junonius]|uniref:Uncharacterized protein n=1 Tax=Gymnopilus junonius TaxID=109634 RepID=A0A9P5NUZ1_GYMJU|nr:hypothetical protein CPB84DRAFT_1768408 [Gymnopilus junonius]
MDKHFFEILSRICDQYIGRLSEYEKDILFPHTGFKLPSQDNIFDEKSLVAYCEVINRHFSRIASTLLFRTKWVSVLGVSTQVDGVSSTDAAADSYLFTQWTLRRFLSSEDKPGFDLVRKYDLQVPMNWEYKNLGFGHEIFSALQTQGGDFHWTACQERSARHGATSKCPNHIHRTEGRLTITGRPTGPDALATVDIIKRSTDENWWGSNFESSRNDSLGAHKEALRFIPSSSNGCT